MVDCSGDHLGNVIKYFARSSRVLDHNIANIAWYSYDCLPIFKSHYVWNNDGRIASTRVFVFFMDFTFKFHLSHSSSWFLQMSLSFVKVHTVFEKFLLANYFQKICAGIDWGCTEPHEWWLRRELGLHLEARFDFCASVPWFGVVWQSPGHTIGFCSRVSQTLWFTD